MTCSKSPSSPCEGRQGVLRESSTPSSEFPRSPIDKFGVEGESWKAGGGAKTIGIAPPAPRLQARPPFGSELE
eukprot:6175799-Pyramimonas_sp.AAC.1